MFSFLKRFIPSLPFLVFLAGLTGESNRPNVLFIACDDLTSAIACYGDPVAVTPNLDRLSNLGVRFDNAYCQLPLCNPARASVMTGLRPDTIKVYDLDQHFRTYVPDAVTLPQLFQQAGYHSMRVGKIYHYNVPAAIGTDGFDDPPSWDLTVNPKGRDKAEEHLITNLEPNRKISAALSWLAAEGTDEEQTDGMIATEAIRLMKENKDQPFFLGVGFFRPHTPYVAPKKYWDLYPIEKIKMPYAPEDDRADIPKAAFAHNNPVPNYNLPVSEVLKAKQAYYANVSFIDAQVGRLLDALEDNGLAENTVVVFWSDHGYHLGEHQGIWQKRCLFEESASAPLIIYAPGQKGNGKASEQVVEFVDIYPTVAELCGLTPPRSVEGKSLKALIDNPAKVWKGEAYTQVLRPGDGLPVMGASIRTDRWRYTEWNEGEQGIELYDHSNDPYEFNNLASQENLQSVVLDLRAKLRAKVNGQVPESAFTPARL
jgi:iduronate 2-sulfatase